MLDRVQPRRRKVVPVLLQHVAVGGIRRGGEHVEEGFKRVFQLERRVLHDRAELLEYPGGSSRDLDHLRIDAGIAKVGAPSNPHSLNSPAQTGAEVRRSFPDGVGVAAVRARQHL